MRMSNALIPTLRDNPADADTVSAWAVDSLEWAYAVEMMIGTGDGKMNPLSDATRATIATVFHRYIENILKLVLEDVK